MDTNEQSITKFAENAVKSVTDYVSPAECLEFLSDTSRFQSLANYIEQYAVANWPGVDRTEVRDLVIRKARALERTDGVNIRNYLRAAWKTDEKGNYPIFVAAKNQENERKYNMKLCFALGLEIDRNFYSGPGDARTGSGRARHESRQWSAEEFLRKACGTYGFNFRDAYETICFYCLLTHQDYSVVLELQKQYEAAPLVEDGPETHFGTVYRGVSIMNSSWESNDLFLSTYLIPNKRNFIGDSDAVAKKYRYLRFRLAENIIREVFTAAEAVGNDRRLSDAKREIAKRLHEQLEKAAETEPDLKELSSRFAKSGDQLDDLEELKSILSEPGVGSAKNSNRMDKYREIVSASVDVGDFCYFAFPFRKITDSSLFKNHSLMHSFPYDKALEMPPDDPEPDTAPMPKKLAARKTIVLFALLNESYRLSRSNWLARADGDKVHMSELKEKFETICIRINGHLRDCGLAELYAADPFDWLVMRCIWYYLDIAFEDIDEEGGRDKPWCTDTPYDFLLEVIRASYPEGED